jgi:hypothetical protein
MRPLQIVFPAFPLFLAACGGVTLSGGLTDPSDDDGGATHHGQGSGGSDEAGTTPGSAGGSATTCSSAGDCPAGDICVWPADQDSCDTLVPAKICVPLGSPPTCDAIGIATGCGCNGQEVRWTTGCVNGPSAHPSVPIAHVGACEDGGARPIEPTIDAGEPSEDGEAPTTDASAADAVGGGACTSNGDCAEGYQCGYLISEGCGATAQCLPGEDWGYCDSIAAACACTGQTIALTGCAQAASQPIEMYPGSCPGSDGGF